MASGGAKNVVLTVISVAAIGAAIYLIVTSLNSGGSAQDEVMQHFVDEASLNTDNPAGVSMTVSEFKAMARARTSPVASNGSTDLVPAGICPTDGKYYALVGHGETPPNCPHCDKDLSGYDVHGNPR